MPERLSREARSQVMAAVGSRDTGPELVVRRLVHGLGYRFRLHRRDLPGTPDIVLPRLRKIINVHGCFWHLHACRHGQRAPRRNGAYWQRKRQGNADRDKRTRASLRRQSWGVLVVWECELGRPERLAARLRRFLERGG